MQWCGVARLDAARDLINQSQKSFSLTEDPQYTCLA